MEEKRLFLLDAYALIFRAYYALIRVPRVTSAGFNTSAIFGFVNTLEELFNKEHPTHIAVCFDPPGPTFRHEASEKYKAEREATPEDISLSIPIIKEIIKAYRIPIIEVDGFEADDVIGTLAKQAAREGFTTYMMTPDKDFGQLVGPSTLQYKPSYRGQDFELRGEKEVCARYGLQRTDQVIDLLALMGDKIDNIPGCPGIGEKTAVKLIGEFDNVENLLQHSDSLKGAMRKKVEENAEQIRFSRFLATIRTDVPIQLRLTELAAQEPDKEKLFALFRSLEFKSLAQRVERRLLATAPATQAIQGSLFDDLLPETPTVAAGSFNAEECDYRWTDTIEKLDELNSASTPLSEVGLYIAVAGDNDMSCRPIGAAIATESHRAWYLPFDFEEGRAFVLDLMARPDICKVSAQSKLDYVVARRLQADGEALANYYDVSLAHYLLQPDMRHTLDVLAETFLNYSTLDMAALTGKKTAKQADIELINREGLLRYCCEQADLALRLREPLQREVEKEGMEKLLSDMELPLVKVLGDMEIAGVRIDGEALQQAADTLSGKLASLESEIFELAGTEFNVGSPSKVGEILFDRLGLDPKAKKTKSGQYSTSEDVLEKVAHKNPIVGKILEYRQLKKLLTTYLTALPASINPQTGKVHTLYNQTITSTGRISSSNPNLQNIPVRDEVGREIRKAFIADPDHLFLSADYSQIELRLVADFAKEETMLEAFREGKDIHAATAAKIYHKPIEEVSANERRNAKTANFGILYGISAFGLASRLGIPRSEAKDIIDGYFASFPKLHQYMNQSIERAREEQLVRTGSGRIRRLPDINSKNPVVRGYAERNAINAPIQGSAADIIKRAMVSIAAEMKERGLKSKMIMQVHDELNFDVVPEELPAMQELVERLMTAAYSGDVTLTASSGVATNWLDAH